MEKYESLRKIIDWIKNSSSEEFMGTFNKLNEKEYSGPTIGDFLGLNDTEELVEEGEPITEEEYEQSIKDNADNDGLMKLDHRVYDALDIAYYIVDKSIKTKRYINVYTLNFILYLIAEEYYRTTGWSIFYDVIVARNFGPVVGCVYREFVVDIQPITVLFPGWSPKKPIHPEDQALFDRVLYVVTESDYFSVKKELTKKGSAWSIAYPPYSGLCLNFIEPELIKECALKKDCSSIEILENNLKKKA